MTWAVFVVIAASLSAARYSTIRHHLQKTPSLVIAFASRSFAILVLLPFLFLIKLSLPAGFLFWGVTALTAVLTAVATVLQYYAMRRSPLADTIPWLALVPLFMLISVFFLYQELPRLLSFVGVLILSGGVWLYSAKTGSHEKSAPEKLTALRRARLAMLASTVIIGLTTALDRIPISEVRELNPESGAFSYTFIWHLMSALIFLLILPLARRSSANLVASKGWTWLKPALWFQALASGLAFLAQMQAVSLSVAENIPAGVILVKAVSLLQLPLAMLYGRLILGEKINLKRGIGSLLMIAGAVIIILGWA